MPSQFLDFLVVLNDTQSSITVGFWLRLLFAQVPPLISHTCLLWIRQDWLFTLSLTVFIHHWSSSTTVLTTWWKSLQFSEGIHNSYWSQTDYISISTTDFAALWLQPSRTIPAINGLTTGILVTLQMSKAHLWSLSISADYLSLCFSSPSQFSVITVFCLSLHNTGVSVSLHPDLCQRPVLTAFCFQLLMTSPTCSLCQEITETSALIEKKKNCWWTTSCHNLSATQLLFLNEIFKLVAKSRHKALLQYITELTNYICNWCNPNICKSQPKLCFQQRL